MSESGAAARPRQLTMVGWFVIGGSTFLVLTIFDSLTNLNSVDSRAQLMETLSTPPWEGLGLSVDEAMDWMRVLLNIAAVCAAAAAVLGAFVLQRHNGARIALTVLAVPLLLSAPITGGLMGALVAAATAMLWTGPARDWFAGRPVRDAQPLFRRPESREDSRPERPVPPVPSPTRPEPEPDEPPPAPTLSTEQPSTRPGASQGFGAAPVAVREQIPPPSQQWAPAGLPGTAPVAGPPPFPVRIACVVAGLFSVVVGLVLIAVMVVLAREGAELIDAATTGPALERAGVSPDSVVPLMWVTLVMALGWSVAGALLAWFTWRRHDWARYLLVTSAVAALIVASAAFPVGLVVQAACVAVVVLLFSAPSRAWFAERTDWYPPAGPPGAPPRRDQAVRPPDPSQGQGKPPVW